MDTLQNDLHVSKKNEGPDLQEKFVTPATLIQGGGAEVEVEKDIGTGTDRLQPLHFHRPMGTLLHLHLLVLRIQIRETVVGHPKEDQGHHQNQVVLLHQTAISCLIAGEVFELDVSKWTMEFSGIMNMAFENTCYSILISMEISMDCFIVIPLCCDHYNHSIPTNGVSLKFNLDIC